MEEINLDSLDLNPSVDFGGGIELLMNDKKSKNQGSNQNTISLEDELNELDSFDVNIEKDTGFKFKKEIPIARETTNLDTNNPSIFKHIDDINVEKEGQKVEKMTKEEMENNTTDSIIESIKTNTIIRAVFRKDTTRQSL